MLKPVVSSVGGLPLGLPVPSSLIVVVTVPTAIVAPLGLLKLAVKSSGPSNTVSSVISTVKVCTVVPGANVNVPLTPVKSAPAVALPLAVL